MTEIPHPTIGRATKVNVLCGECGAPITDPRFVTMIEHETFLSLGVTCPSCGAHHHMDLTERRKEWDRKS